MSLLSFMQVYRHPSFRMGELEMIQKAHHSAHLRKGDYLLQKGQIANEYHIVEEGLIRTFLYDFEGNEITTGFIGDGEVVIEVASIFQRMPTQEYIQCLTDAHLWKIDFTVFQELFHRIPPFREWGRDWMSGELYKSKIRATEMITLPAAKRYLQLVKDHPQVVQQAPLKHIASYLGITDTSLSRIRKEISEGKVG